MPVIGVGGTFSSGWKVDRPKKMKLDKNLLLRRHYHLPWLQSQP
jgi:hypothetical protein